MVESNHGSLVHRKAQTGKIPSAFIRNYSDVYGLPGWQWHSKLVIEPEVGKPILFVHGMSSNSLNNALKSGFNVVQGHFHTKQEIVYGWAWDGSVRWGMTVGCLIDQTNPAFAYAKNGALKPALGVGLIINGIPHILPMFLNKKGRWVEVL